MKVLLINGSPHASGSTRVILEEMAKEFRNADIDTEIFNLPNQALESCRACQSCRSHPDNHCVIDDFVVELGDLLKTVDGIVVGSPVHFAGITGALKVTLDRLFYSQGKNLSNKVFAGVVVARRAGTTAALEQLNKYPLYAQMLLVGGQYWPMVFGANANEVEKDEEGMQNMRTIARKMIWLLQTIDKANNPLPEIPSGAKTNFIR